MSDIIVGSVGVQLVPSAKGFVEKTKGLLANLKADVTLNADTTKAKAQLDEAAHDRESEIHANADTAEANAQLDHAARDRKASIFADVSGFGALTTGLLALGPALVPITAAAGGLVAALGAPIAAVAGGASIYGLIAGHAVKDTEKQSKAIAQLKKQVDAAKVSVSKASTAATKKSALATLATDTAKYNAALKGLSPEQAKFLDAQSKLGASFKGLVTSAGGAVFGPLITGMDALSTILPKLAPVITPVSKALEGLLGDVAKSAQNGALSQFIGFLSTASGPAIRDAGHFLGNIAVGFGQIFTAFQPVGTSVTRGLLNWSNGFAHIGESKGLHDFVGYVQRIGPQVARTLGDVGSAIGHIAKAAAPIGGVVLHAVDGLAKGISHIPTKVLTVTVGALAAIAVSMKAIKLASSAGSLIGKIGSIGSGGGLRGLGGIASKASVVPVFVTNEGFGGAGNPGGVTGDGRSKLSKALGYLGVALPIAGALITAGLASQRSDDAKMTQFQADIKKALVDGIVKGWHEAIKSVKDLRNLLGDPAKNGNPKPALVPKNEGKLGLDVSYGPGTKLLPAYIAQLTGLPQKLVTDISAPGADKSKAAIKDLAHEYGVTPKQIETAIKLLGTNRALTNVQLLKNQLAGLHDKRATVTVAINGASHASNIQREFGQLEQRANGGPVVANRPYVVGEQGAEVIVPATAGVVLPNQALRMATARPASSSHIDSIAGGAGVTVQVGTVQAHDYRDFMSQMQRRSRAASLDGVAR